VKTLVVMFEPCFGFGARHALIHHLLVPHNVMVLPLMIPCAMIHLLAAAPFCLSIDLQALSLASGGKPTRQHVWLCSLLPLTCQ